ncbi:MAG: segregation and condensation protein A [bacterium]
MPYRVQLQNFEGPLDLLLFLIRKNEVDIYDIPIAEITQQYLAFLEVMEFFDLENAGEFILMAATLMRIKAQMLLPRPALEDEELEDPRQELVQRLLEYQRFKEVAGNLADFEKKHRNFYPRSYFEFDLGESNSRDDQVIERDVTLYDLMAAFVEIMKRVPATSPHTVERIPVTVDDQSKFILTYLEGHEQVLISELFAQLQERIIMIVTFVALLDLVKNKRVRLDQNKPFAEIWIRKN